MAVDEETTSTDVKDRPPMGGGGMAISSTIPDVAPLSGKGQCYGHSHSWWPSEHRRREL